MKRLFFMLVILFVLYLGIQYVFYFFSSGEEISYKITKDDKDFYIKEISNFKNNSYLYEIKLNETTFSFRIFNNYNKKTKILEDIYYYSDEEYECILPVFKDDKIFIDVMCMNDNKLIYYSNMDNEDIDKFVDSIEIYNKSQFTDNLEYEIKNDLQVYQNNLIDNHFIGITNYKGLYVINKKFNSIVENKVMFNKDIYNQKLGSFIGKYYVVADYNEEFNFNKLNVVNLQSLNNSTIISDKSISLDGYIQGVLDDKIYLYDKDNNIQYEINPKEEKISKINNEIKYYDGSWTTMSQADAKAEKKFVTNIVNYTNNEYIKIDQASTYYYMYKKNNDKYDCYRIDIENESGLIYLFSTQSTDLINYVDNYVYFVEDNTIKVFNDNFGIRNIVNYKEFEFNKNLKFYVYND